MKGAREFAELFKTTQQIGKLYIAVGSHARGKTFEIWILSTDKAIEITNRTNPPAFKDAIQVYGVIAGLSGWTECYGWLHEGPWQQDFYKIVEEKNNAKTLEMCKENAEAKSRKEFEKERVKTLLDNY